MVGQRFGDAGQLPELYDLRVILDITVPFHGAARAVPALVGRVQGAKPVADG